MFGLIMLAGLGLSLATFIDLDHGAPRDEDDKDDDQTVEAEPVDGAGSLLDDTFDAEGGGAIDNQVEPPAGVGGAASQVELPGVDSTEILMPNPATAAERAPVPIQASESIFGDEDGNKIAGSGADNLINGNGGNDLISGKAGNDTIIAFDDGNDSVNGNLGNDNLHGYHVQNVPGDISFVVEDGQKDFLDGGRGSDNLFLGSGDVGTGGRGADDFHVSWDVSDGHPAEIMDYDPAKDQLYVDYASQHSDADMTSISDWEKTIETADMADGSGSIISIDGEEIARIHGVTGILPSDVVLVFQP